MKTRTLYICYFGLREPLVQTQVLPYLRELRAGGYEVSLLTFEPGLGRGGWGANELRLTRERLAAEGLDWHHLPYHKRPTLPATLYDIARGGLLAARLVRERGVGIVHARNHVAAAMGLFATRRAGGARLVFDVRGFMPEEYVDAGVWPAGGYLYRLTKAAERRLLAAADGFVVLTERARDILFAGRDADAAGRPVEVIPCCVDTARFAAAGGDGARDAARAELGVTGRRVVAYLGALGGWYLTDETADLLAAAHAQDPRSFSLVLTQNPPEQMASRLRARGVADADFLVRRVSPADVPRHLAAADLAVSLIKPCFSKLSSSPTKLAEYLAAGLPVVCNAGVGDVDAVVEGERVGVVLRELTPAAYGRALDAADALRRESGAGERCRRAAARHFDLRRVGGERYRRLYARVLGAGVARPPAAGAFGAGGGPVGGGGGAV